MKNKELQELLSKYPPNMPIKLWVDHSDRNTIVELTPDYLLKSSEGAWIDDEVDPELWDCEDGKIKHKGKRYLLINPLIY